MKGLHDRDGTEEFLGGGGLEAGEAVHRNDVDSVPPDVIPFGEPPLERLLLSGLDHVQQLR